MRIDIHVHLADAENMLAAVQAGTHSYGGPLARALRRAAAGHSATSDSAGRINERWAHRLAGWVRESRLDKVVVLALDGVFNESGRPCPEHTVLKVDNDFVCDAAAQHPEFIFGASVHPYRKDALQELERLIRKGACLIKWIPSAQRIEPDNVRCMAFYEALAHYGVPLLSHTGVEHTLGHRRSRYNHPRRLIPALEKGVRVIAAHCGARLFLHEPSFFTAWAALAVKYETLYGDCGAFSVVTRIPTLRRILGDPVLRSKLLYGSDYPGAPSPAWCWQLGVSKMRELSRVANPVERNLCAMQAFGLPEDVFERAHRQLGIGTGAKK